MVNQTAKQLIGAIIGLGVAIGLCVFIFMLTNNKIVIGYNQGYEPTQPIPYSHKLHAGKLGIDCKYCHSNVEVSRHASVPPMNVCMNCHVQIQLVGSDHHQSPWLKKLSDAYGDNKPIEWVKVHMLPDFVKFNHAPHIQAGKQCQECHGQVQEMEVVRQAASLSMGWCVNCHRKQENHAPINCGTCHY